jgi:predicted PhzF superfamily epimerase YddE/YHI9
MMSRIEQGASVTSRGRVETRVRAQPPETSASSTGRANGEGEAE